MWRFMIGFYPIAWLLWKLGLGPEPTRRLSGAWQMTGEAFIHWLYQDEDGVITDFSEAVSAGEPVFLLPRRRGHCLYIVCEQPVVRGFFYQVEIANNKPCSLQGDYWSERGWKQLGFFDKTRPRNQGTGQQDGRIHWGIPNDSAIATVAGRSGYAVRFSPTCELSPAACGRVTPLTTVPKVNSNPRWTASIERLSACDNRPGLKNIYTRVLDESGKPLEDVKIRFGWESGKGMAYDHPDIWGVTEGAGYLEWTHFGTPSVYALYMENDETPLIENIRTDLGNEYCGSGLGSWIPVNRPGIYSYRIEVQRKGGDSGQGCGLKGEK